VLNSIKFHGILKELAIGPPWDISVNFNFVELVEVLQKARYCNHPKQWLVFSTGINLFQKHLFLHQLTHNMTTDCLLNYEFSTRKIQVQNMLCTKNVFCFDIQNNFCTLHVLLVFFLYWTCNSMNNLSSYCELTEFKNECFWHRFTCITKLLWHPTNFLVIGKILICLPSII
jgi:hypothetical protein